MVPWYVGTTEKLGAIDSAQRVSGQAWLLGLVDRAPHLRAVVAFGTDARHAVHDLAHELSERRIQVCHSMHPSQRNYNRWGDRARREVAEAFEAALRAAS